MPFIRSKYPAYWEEFSRRIRAERAGNECEACGVKNYAVGVWEQEGFRELIVAGDYRSARTIADSGNRELPKYAPRAIVIVLTVAHLCECDPICADEKHVLALCQACHNRRDAPMCARHAAITRAKRNDGRRTLLAEGR